MEKKFGVLVLGEEISKKLYNYLDAKIEAERLVKKLNKTAYIFEVHSKVEISVKVSKIEDYRTISALEINELFGNVDDDDSIEKIEDFDFII